MRSRRVFCVLLALILMFGLMPLDQVAAETKSGDLVYIHFHDHEPGEGAIDSILHTVIVNRGETYGPRPTEVAVSERTEDNITLVVTGWKDAEGNVYSETSPVQTEGADEIDLYPVMSKGAWLFFNAQGGVYVDPQFVPYGENTEEVTTTRDGYTLEGWYDGDTKFQFGSTLDGEKTLTAKWTPQEVMYHVEIWQEAPTHSDDSYYLETTLEEKSLAGETVSLEQLKNIADTYVADHWGGRAFVFNETMTQPYADTVIKGDGSTVVRVFMQRTRHTLVVYDIDGSEIKRIENVKYDVDDWTYAGFTFWKNNVWNDPRVAEINDIKGENGLSKYYWNPSWWRGFWLDPNTYNMHFRLISGSVGFPEEVSIRATERTNRYEYTINNYFEYLDDETTPEGAELVEHTDSDGVTKQYYLDTTYTVWLNTPENGHVQIGPDGFHLERGKGNTVNGNGEIMVDNDPSDRYAIWGMSTTVPSNVFYTRNLNTVRYIPGKGYEDTVYQDEVPFNDLISKYTAQNGPVAGETVKTVENVTYIFRGWSQTENGEPISAEEYGKMRVFPDKDYTFYGIWEPLKYNVVFDPAGGTLSGDETVTVESGNSVEQPEDPTNGDMRFVGWYTDDNRPYYFGTVMTQEVIDKLGDGEDTLTLHARYSDFPGNPVKYYLNGGTGTEPGRDEYFCTGAAFPVASDEGIIPPKTRGVNVPANMVFLGWEAADGMVYQPDDPLIVTPEKVKNDEIPLKALWGYDMSETTDITVTKVWDDQNDKDGLRPKNVTVQLYANGQPQGDPVVLSGDNQWTYTWKELSTFIEGESVTYTADELQVPQGYTKSVKEEGTTITITNTHKPEKPRTGDSNDLGLWAGLGSLSLISLGYILFRRRREEF